MDEFIITIKRYSSPTSEAMGPYSEIEAIEKAKEIRASKEFVRVRILPLLPLRPNEAH